MAKAETEQIDRLARQARDGDRQAFSKIVKLMMNQIAALTYRMTGDREASQDLTQETFISAWENLSRFRGEAAFSSWLYRIASNKSLNYIKASGKRRMDSLDDDPDGVFEIAGSGPDPETLLADRELKQQILQFMASLPEQQKLVFELRFYQQMKFEEISRTLKKAEGTVKTHYRLAIVKLRQWAQQKGLRS